MGRPHCLITQLLIEDGWEPKEAMAEAHRRRTLFNRKYRPTWMLSESALRKRREYNKKWMRRYRASQGGKVGR